MYPLLFLEFIGTSELLVVLVVALIIFGPRKLPELGRSLGRAIHQFQEASDSLKRTWETEALMANAAPSAQTSALPGSDISTEDTPPMPAPAVAVSDVTADADDHAGSV